MKTFRIEGSVIRVDVGPGCWGIIDPQGQEWRLVNMPEQLKYPNKIIAVEVEDVEDNFDIFMWGKPVRIISFGTITP
jgi:hypothetical protein